MNKDGREFEDTEGGVGWGGFEWGMVRTGLQQPGSKQAPLHGIDVTERVLSEADPSGFFSRRMKYAGKWEVNTHCDG